MVPREDQRKITFTNSTFTWKRRIKLNQMHLPSFFKKKTYSTVRAILLVFHFLVLTGRSPGTNRSFN